MGNGKWLEWGEVIRAENMRMIVVPRWCDAGTHV
jgi:hypothetical protein